MLQPKKPVKKYVPTAKEKKNLEDASHNRNMRPPFTPEERKTMKNYSNMGKAKNGKSFDLNKDGKTTFKDVLIGRGVLSKTAKSGAALKKQAAVAIAMKKAGKTPKKMQYGGKAASMAPMKSGGKMKKTGMHKMPDGSMMKNSEMKSGGKMTKCKYGCK